MVLLRVVVSYGAESRERRVLAVGKAATATRRLRAGALVYVVGEKAPKEADHEIEAAQVLALQRKDREPAPLPLPF
jgi:hypothetical protein